MRRKAYSVELLGNLLKEKQADPPFLSLSRKDGYDGSSFSNILEHEDKDLRTVNMKDLRFLTTW